MAHQLQHARAFATDQAQEAQPGLRTTGYAGAIAVNAILMYVAHNLLAWGVPFLTPAFADVLWAIDLSLGATIVANALFIAYDARWFRHLGRAVLSVFSLLSVYTLFRVFPLQFESAWWYEITGLALLAIMFAIVIALIVETIGAFVDGLRLAMSE